MASTLAVHGHAAPVARGLLRVSGELANLQ